MPAEVGAVLASSGRPLDLDVKRALGPPLGIDLSGVRVHTDLEAAQAAASIGARAFTVGSHVVFGTGQWQPHVSAGQHVLAHEVAHVAQQRGGAAPSTPVLRIGAVDDPAEREAEGVAARLNAGLPARISSPVPSGMVQRQGRRPATGTAAPPPRLDFRASTNGAPCACLVFIHNNERSARLTAELLHNHCRYNLAIISPDNRQRLIPLPRLRGRGVDSVDPNELFTRAVAEQCSADPQACRDFLTANAGTADPSVIRGLVERQFYLSIHDCSNGFALPVVALHNNTIDDTAAYRARQAAVDATEIQRGIFARTPSGQGVGARERQADGARPLEELRDWLSRTYGATTTAQLTGRRGTTNIFRWCVSPDIARCHVGDAAHPDTVVWVTNEADFQRLSIQNVNVVLQTGSAPTGESATDLSSLFLVLREVFQARHATVIDQLVQGLEVGVDRIRQLIEELGRLREFGDETLSNTLPRLRDILEAVGQILLRLLEIAILQGALTIRLARLRFLNIETPGTPTSPGQTAAQLREGSYESIAAILRGVGLRCCEADAEGRVRAGLRRGTVEEPRAR